MIGASDLRGDISFILVVELSDIVLRNFKKLI